MERSLSQFGGRDVEGDDDQTLPDAKACDMLTHLFAEITGTDVMLGHYFLQEANWNIDTAVNDYFRRSEQELSASLDLAPNSSSAPSSLRFAMTDEFAVEPSFTILSWNLDGLDRDFNDLIMRTRAVAQIITSEMPDAVFLQEVVPESYAELEKRLSDTYHFQGGRGDYFCVVLLKKNSVRCLKQSLINFDSTGMNRHIVVAEVEIRQQPFKLLCTHLESLKQYSTVRKQQLAECFARVLSSSEHQTVIFGGDLNIRDSEINDIGGIPEPILDVWVACGSPKDAQFSWDVQKNTNNEASYGTAKYKPRARFDRLYLRHSKPAHVEPKEFRFVGTEGIRGIGRYPSDHFGIVCKFAKKLLKKL